MKFLEEVGKPKCNIIDNSTCFKKCQIWEMFKKNYIEYNMISIRHALAELEMYTKEIIYF